MSEQKTIQQAMEDFLISLNSAHTQQAYATPLKHLSTFLAGRGIRIDRVPAEVLTVDHAIDFVPWLRHDCFPDPDQPAKATLQLYLTAVYRFYRSLLKRGVAFEAADIARLEETYRDARNIRGEPRPKDPKLAAVEAIIQAARSIPPISGHKPADRKRELSRLRDIAIVETLRSTGCRVGELIALRREDLDWLAHGALVKGKGSKYRKVYLDGTAWMGLKVYLQARADGGDLRALARLPVFCGHGNRSGRRPSPLTTRHVARIIRDLAEKAGIPEVGVTAHYFRHVFATRALERTENLALVQDMLGHVSPATTRIYARTDEEQRREGYARVWGKADREDRMEHTVDVLVEQGSDAHPLDGARTADGSEEVRPKPSFAAAVSILDAVRVEHDGSCGQETRMLAAMVELLLSTGCSLDELVSVRLDDVDAGSRSLRVTSICRSLSRSESNTHQLNDHTWKTLTTYLLVRTDIFPPKNAYPPDTPADSLFCDADGTPLTIERAYAMLKAVATRAGVSETDLLVLL